MQESIVVTPSELKQMFANLVVDVFKHPEKYQRGTGVHDFYTNVRAQRTEEAKRRNSLDLLDNAITFDGVFKELEEESEEILLKRRCYVVMKCVTEHYFTLEEALKVYRVSDEEYTNFLQHYEVK